MPRNNLCWLIFLWAGNLPVMAWAAEDDTAAIGLLVQENVTLVTSSVAGESQQDLAPLTDGKTSRHLEIKLEPGIPWDLTYQLPAVATCQQLVVTANTRALTKKQLPRIEVLVSTLSSQAGFQSIRSMTLKAARDAQQLDLPPTAAHWTNALAGLSRRSRKVVNWRTPFWSTLQTMVTCCTRGVS